MPPSCRLRPSRSLSLLSWAPWPISGLKATHEEPPLEKGGEGPATRKDRPSDLPDHHDRPFALARGHLAFPLPQESVLTGVRPGLRRLPPGLSTHGRAV